MICSCWIYWNIVFTKKNSWHCQESFFTAALKFYLCHNHRIKHWSVNSYRSGEDAESHGKWSNYFSLTMAMGYGIVQCRFISIMNLQSMLTWQNSTLTVINKCQPQKHQHQQAHKPLRNLHFLPTIPTLAASQSSCSGSNQPDRRSSWRLCCWKSVLTSSDLCTLLQLRPGQCVSSSWCGAVAGKLLSLGGRGSLKPELAAKADSEVLGDEAVEAAHGLCVARSYHPNEPKIPLQKMRH